MCVSAGLCVFLDAGDPGLHLRASLGGGEVGVGQPPAHPLRPAIPATLQVPHVRPGRQKGSVRARAFTDKPRPAESVRGRETLCVIPINDTRYVRFLHKFISVRFGSVQYAVRAFSSLVQFSSVRFSSIRGMCVFSSLVQFSSVRFGSVQYGICALGKAHNYALHPVSQMFPPNVAFETVPMFD